MLNINRNKRGRNLIPANQQVMCEGFPENKWALGLAAFAFALTVGGGIIPAGSPGMCIGENDQTDSDRQCAYQQPYSQIRFHLSFSYDEGTQYFVTGGQIISHPI
jgi:hypothetical protein